MKQYVFDERGERNERVADLEGLVTHHPRANRHARMDANGHLHGVEKPTRRSHAIIGGKVQEVEMQRTDEYRSLDDGRVLLMKDFILEDGRGRRSLDVPSPVAGHVGRVDAPNGLVEIRKRAGGDVIARIRHLAPIAVREGQQVAYGQSLGTQGNAGLGLPPGRSVHVHLEMDTRHYQHMDAYLRDLASGRLPIEAEHRRVVAGPDIADDGVQRLGERGDAVSVVQRALRARGYRGSDGQPVEVDGVYRPVMQGAVLAFQRDQRLPQTGDIDLATQKAAGRVLQQTSPDPLPRGVEGARSSSYPPTHDAVAHVAHPMHRQAERAVHALEASLGRTPDAHSERMTASVLRLAKENGFDRIDHVVLSRQTGHLAAGQNVFVVQGDLDDLGARIACMPTEQAIRTPIDESMHAIEVLERERIATVVKQHDPQPRQHSVHQRM